MIRFDHFDLYLNGRTIVRDLSLTVEPGTTLALMGASGSGKTTLARLLTGLISPGLLGKGAEPASTRGFMASGQVDIGGIDLLRATDAQRRALRGRRAGLVGQALADALNPHMTVLEHVREVISAHRIDRLSAERACVAYNLPERLHHRLPAQLSGGEIQRVLTMLAMVCTPDYVILDEPTAALDPANVRRAAEMFRDKAGQRTQLLITHDLDLAVAIADRLAVLENGKVVDLGTPSVARERDLRKLAGAEPAPRTSWQPCAGDRGVAPASGDGPSNKPLLEIEKLTHHICGKPVLDGLTLTLCKGKCAAIMGASGSGKSTYARVLAGFEPIQAGRIAFRRDDGHQCKVVHAPKAILVSQHAHLALARHFTVEDVVAETLDLCRWCPHGKSTASRHDISVKIKDLLGCVGLPVEDRFRRQKTCVLSGGEAQRLVIARAIATGSQVIVADEPTSALDIIARNQIVALFRKLMHSDGIAVILLTHDDAVATALGDRRFTLEDGRLLERVEEAQQSPCPDSLTMQAGTQQRDGEYA